MTKFKLILFIFILVLTIGCSSQAVKTHDVFDNDNATYAELNTALEELKPVGDEGATHEQFRAVKALRHIAKYMDDPGKREMGIRALVFLMAFSEDNDVEESCETRLDAILSDPDEDLALKLAIIDAQKNIVIAKSGYYVDDSGVFSSAKEMNFIYPDSDFREDALEFLIDLFEDLPLYLQDKSVQAFYEIMANPVTCLEMDKNTCEEDDTEDLQELQATLGEAIGDWLEEEDISPLIKMALIRIADDTGAIRIYYEIKAVTAADGISALNKKERKEEPWLKYWEKTNALSEETKAMVTAAINKGEEEYSELAISSGSGRYAKDRLLGSLTFSDQNSFWFNNSRIILEQQLFDEKKPNQKLSKIEADYQDNLLVPDKWVLSPNYSTEPQSLALKDIILQNAIRALKKGYLFTSSEYLVPEIQQALETAATDSDWSLDLTLTLTANAWASFKKQDDDIESILETLKQGLNSTSSIHIKRLYFSTLISGVPYYRELIEPDVCEFVSGTDILTQHLVTEQVKALQPPIKHLSRSDSTEAERSIHQVLPAEKSEFNNEETEEEVESVESPTRYITHFCNQALYEAPKVVADEEDTIENDSSEEVIPATEDQEESEVEEDEQEQTEDAEGTE